MKSKPKTEDFIKLDKIDLILNDFDLYENKTKELKPNKPQVFRKQRKQGK